jgi:hypothetical protein
MKLSAMPDVTVHCNIAVMLLDDPVDRRQAEPGSIAKAFGRKKWIEDMALGVTTHSTTGVFDGK